MMAEEITTAESSAAVPAWYWIAAVAALLFECAGAYLFVVSLSLDPASLPLDQRPIYDATPQWMTIAWAVAISAGLLGALGLVVRRRLAETLLLISLIALVVQFSGLFLVRRLRELTPEDHLVVPVAILLAAYGIWQLAKLARRRGWLS
jgi:putative Mn2+ efflux pump MntP